MTTARPLARHLTSTRKTLSSAESCTGGLIGHTLTNIPGSSDWYKGGVIAYANDIKIRLLGVPSAMIEQYGAVSAPVAQAMAEGARHRLKSDLAIATTGIAGPAGGTVKKPVGLVFIAMATPKKTLVKKFIFKGSRLNIKKQTLNRALDLLTIEAIRQCGVL
ncbi:MAG: nicotinamide-nucleotide amidohydrolase family protein [Candidatus Omnitrophica bacterium]|nr:nicotinamide-nucleotide amidohydrolase family protein [Candidatus Omnitrophota bacterium]